MKRSVRNMLILLSAALPSCGQKSPPKSASESADAIPGGFINTDDFQVDDSVEDIDATQAAKVISALDFFYFKKTKDDTTQLALNDEPLTTCEVKRDTVQMSADGKSLELTYVFDDSTCPDVKEKYISKMNVFLSIACSDTSLADYVGKSARSFLNTAGAKDFCGKDKSQKTFMNAQYERNSADESAKTLGGMMKADGSPCVATFENGLYKMNDCVFAQKTMVTKQEQPAITSKLVRLHAKNLNSANGGRYYSSGTIEMQINLWKGNMNYTSDNTAPTYELESDGAKVKGSFVAGIYE